MTTSIDRQAEPNTDHNRADRQGRVRLALHAEKPLLFDLECDIINAKQWKVYDENRKAIQKWAKPSG